MQIVANFILHVMKNLKSNFLLSTLSICLFIFSDEQIFAQSDFYLNYKIYGDNQGYKNNGDAPTFVQDSCGYIWIGSNLGIYRFDGTFFRLFPVQQIDSVAAFTSVVKPLLIDRENILLYIENNGLYWWNCNSFTANKISLQHDSVLHYVKITSAWKQNQNSIWLTTLFQGIIQLDFAQHELHDYLLTNDTAESKNWISVSTTHCIIVDSTDWFYVSTNKGLIHFNQKTFEVQKIILPDFLPATDCRNTLGKMCLIKNKLWIGTWGNGMLCYNTNTKSWEQFLWNNSQTDCAHNIIYDFTPKSESEFWICTRDEGLLIYNLQLNTFSKVFRIDESETKQYPLVWDLFTDHQNICWTSDGENIFKLSTAESEFTLFQLSSNSAEFFNSAYHFQNDSTIYFTANNHNGIYAVNYFSKQIKYYSNPLLPYGETAYNIDVYDAAEKKLFVISADGCFSFDTESKKFQKIFSVPTSAKKSIYGNAVSTLDHEFWYGYDFGFLYATDEKTLTTKEITTEDLDYQIPNTNAVIGLYADVDGGVWISSKNGYGLLYHNSKKNLNINLKNKYPLLNNNVVSMCELADGSWFICLAQWGLLWLQHPFTPQEKIFHFTEQQNQLLTNRYRSCSVDANGNVWLNSEKGITCFITTSMQFVNYKKGDGLPYTASSMNMISIENQMLMPIHFGWQAWVIENQNSSATKKIPNAVINLFYINGKEVNYNINSKKSIDLNYKNSIRFQFSALNFYHPEKLIYQYKMDGMDQTWSASDGDHTIAFSNLPSGNFTLLIRTSFDGMNWNENALALNIKVHPPVWQTWWFMLIVVATIILILILLVRKRIKSVRHEQQLFLQITDSELKALRAQMNPHFIFNCMNTIEALIATNNEEAATTFVQHFSKLMRLVLENSMHQTITLEKDFQALQMYIKLEQIRFKNLFDVQLSGFDDSEIKAATIPPLLLQPFVENAIRHGLQPLNTRKGLLKISCTQEKYEILISIEDNGVGRSGSSSSGHQSLGSGLTENRIKFYNNIHSQKISFIIIDLVDADKNPCGTKVEIRIPF